MNSQVGVSIHQVYVVKEGTAAILLTLCDMLSCFWFVLFFCPCFIFIQCISVLDKFGAAMMVVKSDISGNITVRFHL